MFEPTIYCNRDEHASNCTTDIVENFIQLFDTALFLTKQCNVKINNKVLFDDDVCCVLLQNNFIGGVTVSVFASSAVDRGDKPNTITLVFVASPLSI